MGTALNKILKDMITRFHQMNGKDSICSRLGLSWASIEWKMKNNTKKRKNKDEVPIKDFRQECEILKVGSSSH